MDSKFGSIASKPRSPSPNTTRENNTAPTTSTVAANASKFEAKLNNPQDSKKVPTTEEVVFLKAENARLEAELQASMDNLLLVVDEVKFMEDEVCYFFSNPISSIL